MKSSRYRHYYLVVAIPGAGQNNLFGRLKQEVHSTIGKHGFLIPLRIYIIWSIWAHLSVHITVTLSHKSFPGLWQKGTDLFQAILKLEYISNGHVIFSQKHEKSCSMEKTQVPNCWRERWYSWGNAELPKANRKLICHARPTLEGFILNNEISMSFKSQSVCAETPSVKFLSPVWYLCETESALHSKTL